MKPITLDSIRDTITRITGGRPPLRSLTVHPDDYTMLSNSTAKAEVGVLAPFVGSGVAVYTSPLVPRGQAVPDPPDAIDPRVLAALSKPAVRVRACDACAGTGVCPGDHPIACTACDGGWTEVAR